LGSGGVIYLQSTGLPALWIKLGLFGNSTSIFLKFSSSVSGLILSLSFAVVFSF